MAGTDSIRSAIFAIADLKVTDDWGDILFVEFDDLPQVSFEIRIQEHENV